MKKLSNIYLEAKDRIFLNSKINNSTAKNQIKKDCELISRIEEVFNNPGKWDVYYTKDSMKLVIEKLTENPKNYFNRINVEIM